MINSLINSESDLTEYEFIEEYIGKNIDSVFELYEQIFVNKKKTQKCFSELQALIFKIENSYILFYFYGCNITNKRDFQYFIRIHESQPVTEQETKKDYSCAGGYDYENNLVIKNNFFDDWENKLTEFGFVYDTNNSKKGNLIGFYIQVNGYKTMYAMCTQHKKNIHLNGTEWVLSERPKNCIMKAVSVY